MLGCGMVNFNVFLSEGLLCVGFFIIILMLFFVGGFVGFLVSLY